MKQRRSLDDPILTPCKVCRTPTANGNRVCTLCIDEPRPRRRKPIKLTPEENEYLKTLERLCKRVVGTEYYD